MEKEKTIQRDKNGRYIKGNIPWMKGKHLKLSEDHKSKISLKLKGRKISEEQKKLMSEKYKGISFIDRYGKEKAMKMIESARLKKLGRKQSPETIAKRVIHLRRPCSEEKKKKISLAQKGRPKLGFFKKEHKVNVGRKLSEETKLRIGRANKIALLGKLAGNKHPNWKGGKSLEEYGKDFNNEIKDRVKKRDHYTCQLCFLHKDNLKHKFNIHHIDFNKKNNDINNLVTLCIPCHIKTNRNREEWTRHFQKHIEQGGYL